jgi:hypothetical protein
MELLPSDSSDDSSNELSSTANVFEEDMYNGNSGSKKVNNNRQNSMDPENSNGRSGRIRTFPHIHGQWPCSIYLHVENDSNFSTLQHSALTNNCKEIMTMKQLKWEVHENEFHASLSKEFMLPKHQINLFVQSIKKAVESRFHKYTISLTDECVIHTNPENTRSFIGLVAHGGTKNTISIIESINNVLDQFSLPTYYKNPSIHVSIASAVGNVMSYLSNNDNPNPKIIDRIKCKKIECEEENTYNNTGMNLNKNHISSGLRIISNTNNEEMLEMSVVINHIVIKTGHVLNKVYLKS